MFEIIVIGFLLIGYLMIFPILFLMSLSLLNKFRYKTYKFDNMHRPKFSLIVPAHNEEKVIARTINKFLRTTYPPNKKEIIIINDGSTDKTKKIVERYAYKIIDSSTGNCRYTGNDYKNVILVNRKEGGKGKSHVVNDGKRYASSDIFFFIDADVQVNKDVFERAAKHFIDDDVGAVAGYVSVSEKKNKILNNFVDFECAVAQRVMRRGFDTIGIHYIVPGGCAIFRKEIFESIGDYMPDTLAEDTDITWRLITETTKKVHFDPSIVVKADEPTTLIGLWNQRVRWARGNLGVTWKHRKKVGKKKHGRAVTIGYPFWIATMCIPLTFIFTTIGLLLGTIFSVNLTFISILGRILAFAFYGTWISGIIVNNGKSWFGGLMSPGIPILTTLSSSLIYSDGIKGLVTYIGYPNYANIIGLSFLLWILISLPATYFTLRLSKRYPKISNFLQLGLFGYWIILVTSALHGYFKELIGEEKVWIRTVR